MNLTYILLNVWYFFSYYITHMWYTIICLLEDEHDKHHLGHMDDSNIKDIFYLILKQMK